MTNRIKIAGMWYHIGKLDDVLLSRCHSEAYEHGIMYQVHFGSHSATLELDPDQAERLGEVLHGSTTDEGTR